VVGKPGKINFPVYAPIPFPRRVKRPAHRAGQNFIVKNPFICDTLVQYELA